MGSEMKGKLRKIAEEICEIAWKLQNFDRFCKKPIFYEMC